MPELEQQRVLPLDSELEQQQGRQQGQQLELLPELVRGQGRLEVAEEEEGILTQIRW